MNTKEALQSLFLHGMLERPGESIDDLLAEAWIWARVGKLAVPVLPVVLVKSSLIQHDIHHIVTGYGTSLKEELALAAWELASGGCGWDLLYWIDRLIACALGLLWTPRALFAAMRRGRHHKNLYGMQRERLLASDFDELRQLVLRES